MEVETLQSEKGKQGIQRPAGLRFAKALAVNEGRGTIPTAEQLKQINKFTRREYAAEELYVGIIDLANDQVDRAFEWFPVPVLKQFAQTIVGRCMEMGHEYAINPPQALFFDAAVVKAGDVNWLRCWYYLPKTDENAHLREMLDAGVYRYASIGFAPADGASYEDWGLTCDICGKSYWRDPNEAEQCPHVAGEKYEDRSTEVICTIHYTGKWQALEGSIVYLGCQYGAEMKASEPGFAQFAQYRAMQDKIAESYAVMKAYGFAKSFEGITVPRRKVIDNSAIAAFLDAAEIIDPTTKAADFAIGGEVVGSEEEGQANAEELMDKEIDAALDLLQKSKFFNPEFYKSGRVLSAANEAKIGKASELLSEVLSAVQAAPEVNAAGSDAANAEIAEGEQKEAASAASETIESPEEETEPKEPAQPETSVARSYADIVIQTSADNRARLARQLTDSARKSEGE